MCIIEPMKMKKELHPSLLEEFVFFHGFIFSNLQNVIFIFFIYGFNFFLQKRRHWSMPNMIRIHTLFYFSRTFPLIYRSLKLIFLFKSSNLVYKACNSSSACILCLKLVFLFKSLYSSFKSCILGHKLVF